MRASELWKEKRVGVKVRYWSLSRSSLSVHGLRLAHPSRGTACVCMRLVSGFLWQEAHVQSLLSTPLVGAAALLRDVTLAVHSAFGSPDCGVPSEALPIICEELRIVLTIFLKRLRLAYRSELPLPSLAAPVMLLALRQAAADKVAFEPAIVSQADVTALRSDLFSLLYLLVKQECANISLRDASMREEKARANEG